MMEFLSWLQASPLAHGIAKSNHMVIASLQIVHVFGFIFLLAPLLLVALRLLGLVLGEQPLDTIIGPCRNLSLIGLAMSIGSGVLMFTSAPLHYYANWAFDAKMCLLVAALGFYALLFWRLRRKTGSSWFAKLNVSVSLLLWIAVCMAGRAIGFV